MKRTTLSLFAFLFCLAPVFAQGPQPWAKETLAKSARHQEWVAIKSGDRTVNAFIVYPEVKTKAPAVIVIHEIFGLSDWVQTVADKLAANGYIAIAPDLLSGLGPTGKGSAELTGQDLNRAVSSLPPDQVTADLNAVADYVKKLPSANGKLAVTGFCWGGARLHAPRRRSRKTCPGKRNRPRSILGAHVSCPENDLTNTGFSLWSDNLETNYAQKPDKGGKHPALFFFRIK